MASPVFFNEYDSHEEDLSTIGQDPNDFSDF